MLKKFILLAALLTPLLAKAQDDITGQNNIYKAKTQPLIKGCVLCWHKLLALYNLNVIGFLVRFTATI
jgi:hypothetical protein